MVSIMASPTNRVREIVPAASGWRAIASMAAATDRPSPSAGPIEPIETATAAAMMLMTLGSIRPPGCCCGSGGRLGSCSSDEDRGQHREDIGLHHVDQQLEGHDGYG